MKIHISAEQLEGVVKELNCAVLNIPSATESFTMKGGGTFVIKSGDTYIVYVNYFGRVSSDNSENDSPLYDESPFALSLEEMFEADKLTKKAIEASEVPAIAVTSRFLSDLIEWLDDDGVAIEDVIDAPVTGAVSSDSEEGPFGFDWDV